MDPGFRRDDDCRETSRPQQALAYVVVRRKREGGQGGAFLAGYAYK